MDLSKSVVLGTCTLAEKLESLKLFENPKVHICMADKLAIRKYVSPKTNDPNLLNHLYGVYNSPNEMHLGELFSECIYNLSIVNLAMKIHQFDLYFRRNV